MARYFVTGTTGFIGSHVAARLRQQGHAVTTIVRDPSRADALRALGVEVHPGDITAADSMREPMRGADGVFHIAAWYKVGVRDAREAERVNVEGTRNVLALMQALGIPKGVYTSTLAVHGDTRGRIVDEAHRHDGPWLSHYDRTKHDAHIVAEQFIRQGVPLVIVQPGVVIGPGDTSGMRTLLVQYLTRTLPMVPGGSAFCWAHIDDIAQGHLLAMERGRLGESYHLAGEPASLTDALALAERLTGIPRPSHVAPPWLLRTLSGLMRPVAAIARLEGDYHPESLRVMAGATYLGRADKARRELGWTPRSLEEALRQTLFHEMSLLGMPLPAVPAAASPGASSGGRGS